MWLIVLLVMAAAAYLVVKVVLKNADPAVPSSTEALSAPDADDLSPSSTGDTVQIDSGAASAHSASPDAQISADDDTLNAKAAAHGVKSGNEVQDVHELIKILNLRDSDASRLGIDRDQFNTLANGSADGSGDGSATGVSAETVSSVRRQLIGWLT